ncbi:MAG: glycosyltransferase family 4 protein [Thermodesulfobacteriota bacterium]
MRKMRILFVTFGLPYPPDSGVRIHDFYLIKNVSQLHSVSLLSLITSPEQEKHVNRLRPHCDMVDFVIAKPRRVREHLSGIMRGFLARRPLATHPYLYDEMASKIHELVTNRGVDIVQIEHSFLAPYIEAIPADSNCKKILSFHNLGVNQYKRMIYLKNRLTEKSLFLLKWMLMLRWEAKYAERFDRSLVVSALEEKVLRSANPNVSVSVIENGVDTTLYQPLVDSSHDNALLFVGVMGYPPNIDAVLYFCESIMPLIQDRIPSLKLFIVGHEPAPEIRRLAERENVVVTGYVDDVTTYYRQSQVTVVPLRGGGGTRLKILESMALGRPVVSTTLGCEGLNVTDKEDIMIADTPSEFAERVIQLLKDKELRDRIARNARLLVETHYDWKLIGGRLMTLYDNMVNYSKTEKSIERPIEGLRD